MYDICYLQSSEKTEGVTKNRQSRDNRQQCAPDTERKKVPDRNIKS